jgi:hypothetical protein
MQILFTLIICAVIGFGLFKLYQYLKKRNTIKANTPGMGLNNLDDSRVGIERYLKRNLLKPSAGNERTAD